MSDVNKHGALLSVAFIMFGLVIGALTALTLLNAGRYGDAAGIGGAVTIISIVVGGFLGLVALEPQEAADD